MSHFVEILTFFKDYVIHDISIIRSLNNQHCFILNYASYPLHMSYVYDILI